MLEKYKIAVIVTGIISIAIVLFMYSKNYITFESGIHIVLPDASSSYVEKEFQPANIEREIDTVKVSKVQMLSPSNTTNDIDEEFRLYDDFMKAVETFMPLLITLIPFYIHKRKKNKISSANLE